MTLSAEQVVRTNELIARLHALDEEMGAAVMALDRKRLLAAREECRFIEEELITLLPLATERRR